MKHLSRFLPVIMALMLIFARIDRKGSFDMNAGGTSKGGEVPVTPGLVAADQYEDSASFGDTMKHGGRPTLVG